MYLYIKVYSMSWFRGLDIDGYILVTATKHFGMHFCPSQSPIAKCIEYTSAIQVGC